MPPNYTEDEVENAYLDVTDNHLSINQAAAKYGIPRSTLWNRLHGIRSWNERNVGPQRLSSVEERDLAGWIVRQDSLGYAPGHSVVRSIVEAILKQKGDTRPLGKN